MTFKLLNIDSNAKTVKGQKKGYMTAILYLAPANLSGYEVCPNRTKGCTDACLNTAGRGAFNTTQKARIRKTKMFFEQREEFMKLLEREIEKFIKHAENKDMIPTVRLNGTSDLNWSKISYVSNDGKKYRSIIEKFSTVQFYDYTKRPNAKSEYQNYHLTFSLAEDNEEAAKNALSKGMNVAVVFRNENFPKTFWGKKTFSADETDLRFLDPKNSIAALKAKGKARKDNSGFVRDVVHLPVLK